jgi:putative flippase GtrA
LTETIEAVSIPADADSSANLKDRLSVWIQSKNAARFAKFFVVGIVGAVIDFTTYSTLNNTHFFDQINIDLFGFFTITGLGVAGTCGFLLAIISNFFWNRYWVYPDSRSKSLMGQVITFFIVSVASILIRIPIVELLTFPLERIEHYLLPSLAEKTVRFFGETSSWALSVIAVMFWNFFVNRYWTFNDVK